MGMFRLLLRALVISAVAHLTTVCVSAANGGPTYAFSATYEVHATRLNTAEGVTVASSTYQDATNFQGAQVQNHTAPNGFYATLIRNDKKKIYFHYARHVNATVHSECYAYSFPVDQPMIAPQFGTHSGKYIRDSIGPNGKPVAQFEHSDGKYILTAQIYRDSMAPAALLNTDTFGAGTIVTKFVNGSVEDQSVFDVPSVCDDNVREWDQRMSPAEMDQWLKANLASQSGDPSDHWRLAFGDVFRRTPSILMRVGGSSSGGFNLRKRGEQDGVNNVRPFDAVMQAKTSELAAVTFGGALPAAVDNRQFATPVRDQAWCGACFAFSAVASAEIVMRKASQANQTYDVTSWMSVQAMIDCTHTSRSHPSVPVPARGCQGGSPTSVFETIIERGIVADVDYRFTGVTGARCDLNASSPSFIKPLSAHYQTAARNTTQMMEAVATYGALSAIINFNLNPPNGDAMYSGGVYDHASCTPSMNHVITVVGYGRDETLGRDYWLLKNSVGQAWGEGGYMKMARGVNMCGIEDYGYVPVPSAK